MGRSYWNTGESYKQPDASQLQRNARQTMKKEKAKGKQLEPVVIQGRTIVKSWWGQAWCDNLEKYADFAIQQIEEKKYEMELKAEHYKKIIKYGIAFCEKVCYTKLSPFSD